jgi:TonB family protein
MLALCVVGRRPRRPPAPDAIAESYATVTVERAELKPEPSARSHSLEQLRNGARLAVVGVQGRWVEVRTASQRRGFLLSETIETDGDRQLRQKRAGKILSFPAVMGVVVQDTNILLAPFPLSPQAGRLRQGSTVEVHAVDHDYYAFRSGDGAIAFVASGDVDLVPPDPRQPAIVPDKSKGLKDLTVSDLPSATAAASDETGDESEQPQESGAALEKKVAPKYPEAARSAGVEGTVVLDVLIDEKGQVTDIQVLRGLPLGVSEAAVSAVSRWQYRPARGRTGPVASRKTVRVQFSLER